ncbi:M15 family metallopeptidase [Thalassobacillus hwangdonensis]|uniref:D-alanyl-D-alanine carboxypeptidase family protein n=1 Tax=Thalassobacillus hwangdonensis TaxID=546108 RepID=A0ABW3KV31_9BACI
MRFFAFVAMTAAFLFVTGCSNIDFLDSSEQTHTAEETPKSEKEVEQKDASEIDEKSDGEDASDKEEKPEDSKEEQETPSDDQQESTDKQEEKESEPKKDSDGLIIIEDPNSTQLVVNKQRKLPEGYEPKDLVVPDVPFYFNEFLPKKQMRKEAAGALERLFAGAKKDGIELVAASGYRSYDRQKTIYENNVKANGEEHANKFSAKPGTSEHQTGLAMDVTSAQMAFKLEQDFIETAEGEWLANHAHEYGFVIRYPKGKTEITGYEYEPWHLRYVGKESATEIHTQEATLEEFFGLYP